MKITYYKGDPPNFGDELNPWLWPKLIPDFFDEKDDALFLGIGSIFGEDFIDRFPSTSQKIVFGAGYVPAYSRKPNLNSNWKVYFVRGPRTALQLNLPANLSLGDPAYLVKSFVKDIERSNEVVSFIPHCASLDSGNWEKVYRLAGINLINPRRPVEEVIKELLRSRLVLAEAMHGAIVADALRVPWIPLLPIDAVNRDKWFDWAEALDIELQPYRLWPSNLVEIIIALFGREETLIYYRPRLPGVVEKINQSRLLKPIDQAIHHIAAHRLSQLAKATPCLSADNSITRVTSRMLERVEQLSRDYAA